MHVSLLHKPTTSTHFANRAFRCAGPSVWNSLTSCTVDSGLLTVFNSRLQTFQFRAKDLLRVIMHNNATVRQRATEIPQDTCAKSDYYYYDLLKQNFKRK